MEGNGIPIIKRRQIAFACLPYLLQVEITEKMEFFDQIEFESSSRCGKATVASVKYAPIVEVPRFLMGNLADIEMMTHGTTRMGCWARSDPEIRRVARLPRLKLQKLILYEGSYINEFMELLEKTEFVAQDMSLWMDRIGQEETTAFFRISEKFTVKECSFNYAVEVDLYFAPAFQQIEKMTMKTYGGPYEAIVQLKASTIFLDDRSYTGQIPCLATLFLQQWARKERSIDKLEIITQQRLECKTLLAQLLPTMDVKAFAKRQAKFELLLEFMEMMELEKHETKEDFLFSISREDRKLMLFVHPWRNQIIAKEYVTLKGYPNTKIISMV